MDALKIVRADLHGQPAGHLTHRAENRPATIGALDRFIRNREDFPFEQSLRQPAIGSEVKIGEQRLAFFEQGILCRKRFLDLDDQISAVEDQCLLRNDLSARLRVLCVVQSAAGPSSRLDHDTMARFQQGPGSCRRQGDTELLVFGLLWDADDHGLPASSLTPSFAPVLPDLLVSAVFV